MSPTLVTLEIIRELVIVRLRVLFFCLFRKEFPLEKDKI